MLKTYGHNGEHQIAVEQTHGFFSPPPSPRIHFPDENSVQPIPSVAHLVKRGVSSCIFSQTRWLIVGHPFFRCEYK